MSSRLSLRLQKDLAEKLFEVAGETKKSPSFHIQKALGLYLAEIVDFQIAYDRSNDMDDPVISIDEIKNELTL